MSNPTLTVAQAQALARVEATPVDQYPPAAALSSRRWIREAQKVCLREGMSSRVEQFLLKAAQSALYRDKNAERWSLLCDKAQEVNDLCGPGLSTEEWARRRLKIAAILDEVY